MFIVLQFYECVPEFELAADVYFTEWREAYINFKLLKKMIENIITVYPEVPFNPTPTNDEVVSSEYLMAKGQRTLAVCF